MPSERANKKKGGDRRVVFDLDEPHSSRRRNPDIENRPRTPAPARGSSGSRGGSPTMSEGTTSPPPNAPSDALNTYINPAVGYNPVYTHFTQPSRVNPTIQFAQPTVYTGPPQSIFVQQPQTIITSAAPATIAMGDYQNRAPFNSGINFQPQVPDTSNGPMLHTYQPRQDVTAGPSLVYVQPATAFSVSQPVHFVQIVPVALVWRPSVFYASSSRQLWAPSHLWFPTPHLGLAGFE